MTSVEFGFSMVQECVDSYSVRELPDGSATISIEVPSRFRDRWLAKLSELRATAAEIEHFGRATSDPES